MKTPEISIIIPCYNEEKNIFNTIKSISSHFNKTCFEIIVIDDGSNDNTRKIINSIDDIIINEKRENKGKGYSIKEGVLKSRGKKILITDADLSTPIDEYQKLNKFIDEYEIVIGSRGLNDSQVENNIFRIFFGKVGNILIRCIVKNIKDTQCGFKLFKTDVAKDIFSLNTLDRFGYDFELLFLAQKKNYNIKEVAIKWKSSDDSKVKIIDYFHTFIELIKVFFNERNNKYSIKS